MIRRFICTAKIDFSAIFRAWRNVVFPPFCKSCKAPSETKLFCPDCWAECAPPERAEKCPHCFEDSDKLCRNCQQKPELAFPRAYVFEDTPSARMLVKESADIIAAFVMHAWGLMDWPTPDLIIPISGALEIATHFSEMINKPIANLKSGDDLNAIDVGQIFLIINVRGSLDECKRVVQSLSTAIPKRGYLISLYQLS